ncbi:uncharacterized protein LOC116393656 [Anarrhichthys ocellatus]|uniref:uncharacterized protein LOC116393656 n=1 Tax=Anarrhichthys ocellatus TaxID=433405 RepID=UPI0012EE4A1B|nr:uncharacterized protein LOC116393656 [Anarrhichthys ocellatus]
MMRLLELILISVLQFEALISGQIIYKRPREDAVLPCAIASSSGPTCPIVSWFYNREPSQGPSRVEIGDVSVPAARLSVDTTCSLVIKSVTAEDAGLYICRQKGRVSENVYLNVLAISPSPPDADPKRDGKVTLECTLWRHSSLRPCRLDGLNWLDETRTLLRRRGPGYHFRGQRKCVSTLTVNRQSDHNRRYTCQFVDDRHVVIEAEYTPDFTGGTTSDPGKITCSQRFASLFLRCWSFCSAGYLMLFFFIN